MSQVLSSLTEVADKLTSEIGEERIKFAIQEVIHLERLDFILELSSATTSELKLLSVWYKEDFPINVGFKNSLGNLEIIESYSMDDLQKQVVKALGTKDPRWKIRSAIAICKSANSRSADDENG